MEAKQVDFTESKMHVFFIVKCIHGYMTMNMFDILN